MMCVLVDGVCAFRWCVCWWMVCVLVDGVCVGGWCVCWWMVCTGSGISGQRSVKSRNETHTPMYVCLHTVYQAELTLATEMNFSIIALLSLRSGIAQITVPTQNDTCTDTQHINKYIKIHLKYATHHVT